MGIAMAITSVAAPLVMDEDLDPTIVLYVRAVSIGLAFMMLLLFAFLPGTPKDKAKHKKLHLQKVEDSTKESAGPSFPKPEGRGAIEAMASKLREEARFCKLVLNQSSLWLGQKPEGEGSKRLCI